MTSADDAIILDRLKAVPYLNVHDGYVTDSDENEKTISAPLPYVVFYATPDLDRGDSLAASATSRLVEFQINFVGETREQAKVAGERARGVLNRQRLQFPTGTRLVRRDDNSLMVRRDDTWTRPGGGPLFYGADHYSVLI